MAFPLTPYAVLAQNRRNWRIVQLGDRQIQLDFGPFALALPSAAFQRVHGLIEAALRAPGIPGCVAHTGTEGSIWFDATHGVLLVVYQNTVIRLTPHELLALAVLCREAGAALAVAPCLPASCGCVN
jgi:hypothetical protein